MTVSSAIYERSFSWKYVIVFFALYFISLNIFSQSGRIKIIDSKSNEPVPFATVLLKEFGSKSEFFKLSDANGEIINPCINDAVIKITFVGYNTLIDTILADKSYELYLTPTVFSLNEVVVTGGFQPQRADKSIYNIKVIDSRKIEARAATNLADVLINQANINITYNSETGSNLKVKGLSGNNVKILIDGVPVIGRMGGNIDLSQLNLYNIDHIEIVEGPMSVIYGSDAMAGAINLITKDNRNSNFGLTANSYYETGRTYNFDSNVNFRKKRHSFSASVGRNFFEGYHSKNEDTRSQTWKPKEQYSGDFYYLYSHDNAKIKYQTSIMRERLLDKGNLLGPRFYTANDSWFYSARITNRIDYDRTLENGLAIKMLAAHSYYQRRKITYNKDLYMLKQTLASDSSLHDTTKLNSFVYRLVIGKEDTEKKFNYTLGLDIKYENGKGKRIADNRQDIGDYAFFTSIKYNMLPSLSLQPGFRIAYNTSFDIAPVPSVNLSWRPKERLNIRTSYARGYRAPTVKELFIYFQDVNHNIIPNPDLMDEYGHNVDFSVSYNTERNNKIHYSAIDFGLFYNNIHNIIQIAQTKDPEGKDAFQYINIFKYNTLGYQISLAYDFYPYLDITASIGTTGMYASLDDKKATLNDYRLSSNFSTTLGWTIPSIGLKVSAYYKFTDRDWLFSTDYQNNILLGKVHSYHTLDLTFLRSFFSNRLSVASGIKNIFNNSDVITSGNIPAESHSSGDLSVNYGRLVFLKLSYSLLK